MRLNNEKAPIKGLFAMRPSTAWPTLLRYYLLIDLKHLNQCQAYLRMLTDYGSEHNFLPQFGGIIALFYAVFFAY